MILTLNHSNLHTIIGDMLLDWLWLELQILQLIVQMVILSFGFGSD